MSDASVLPKLADGSPAGPDLGLDPLFGEMELAAKGKPEGQFGTTVEPATPPDWRLTGSLAEQLLERTQDLRVLSYLAVARLHDSGLPGFASGLAMIRASLETNWAHVHPQLDPEDDNDPMLRANALLALQKPLTVLRPLRDAPLALPPRGRPVAYRDIAVLNGSMELEVGRERISEAEVRDTFNKTDPIRHAALRAAAAAARTDLAAIGTAFDGNTKMGSGPDLSGVVKLIGEIGKELARYEPVPPEAEIEAGLDEVAEPLAMSGTEVTAPRRRSIVTIRSVPAIDNRDDALHALELAAAYFRKHEPSSPVPLLIDRARRLAPLPFLEVLRDLAPDGLLQAQTATGTGSE